MARVLVIDDDAGIRATIRTLLELHGFEVVLATGGSAGVRALRAEPYDLVIVDVFMPDMDGFETIRLLRKLRPAMPIIVVSGFGVGKSSAPDFLGMATKLGADFSLAKPFTAVELLNCVSACVSKAAT